MAGGHARRKAWIREPFGACLSLHGPGAWWHIFHLKFTKIKSLHRQTISQRVATIIFFFFCIWRLLLCLIQRKMEEKKKLQVLTGMEKCYCIGVGKSITHIDFQLFTSWFLFPNCSMKKASQMLMGVCVNLFLHFDSILMLFSPPERLILWLKTPEKPSQTSVQLKVCLHSSARPAVAIVSPGRVPALHPRSGIATLAHDTSSI